jgi:hypothetical protein
MKVWFGTTTSELEEYKEYYFAIRDYLKEKGCFVLFDWLEDAVEYRKSNPTGKRSIKNIYQEICSAISVADIVVIEYTVPNFSSSDQIHQALFKKKPTLVMRLHKDNTFADSYIEAIDSPFLTVREYDLTTYSEIIDEFIGYSQLETGKGRYNIVLDRKHKYYLDWASSVYKKSSSALIRDLIEERIENDAKFKPHIRRQQAGA